MVDRQLREQKQHHQEQHQHRHRQRQHSLELDQAGDNQMQKLNNPGGADKGNCGKATDSKEHLKQNYLEGNINNNNSSDIQVFCLQSGVKGQGEVGTKSQTAG